jgi:antitoxin (DNA-binding transcriptional repressor) of toxin-antitoxin stability system
MSTERTPDLDSVLRERGGHAYIVTVTEHGGPHAVYVPVRREGAGLVAEVGAQTAANAAARPRVSLLFPVRSEGDYSLIVDGAAVVESPADSRRVQVTPTKVVLHRPGPPPDPASACGADCVPIAVPLAIGRP